MEERNGVKFNPGRIVATRGIAERMEKEPVFREFCMASLARHLKADWGDLEQEDWAVNNEALKSGEDRMFSAYIFGDTNEKIWIITEWDRSATTILYPSEY